MKNFSLILFIFIASLQLKAQNIISIKEINKHLGETVTICDSVYTTRALGALTLLNLGAPFPKQLLTGVIYKADLSKFNEPEKTFLNRRVCVTGKLVLYNDKPQIVMTESKQISFITMK